MKRRFLLLFGLYGMLVSCMQGVEPFIELSRWIKWIVDHWVEFTRAFWSFILGWFPWGLPRDIADALTGVTYYVACLIGFMRTKDRSLFRFFELVPDRKSKLPSKPITLKRLKRFPTHLWFFVYSNLLFAPLTIVLITMFNGSMITASVFAAIFLFSIYINDFPFNFLSKLPYRWQLRLGVRATVIRGYSGTAAVWLILTYVFGLMLVVLFLNEIALRGNNILDAYQWARCEAGIECIAPTTLPDNVSM